MKAYKGVQVSLHSLLTSTPDEIHWLTQPPLLYSRERTEVPVKNGGCVSPKFGLQLFLRILGNDQLDALFLNVFILCLYMFRAASAHHQEVQIVLIHHLV
jgi:hypothetical protein